MSSMFFLFSNLLLQFVETYGLLETEIICGFLSLSFIIVASESYSSLADLAKHFGVIGKWHDYLNNLSE